MIDRLAREERLERHVAVVLVERRRRRRPSAPAYSSSRSLVADRAEERARGRRPQRRSARRSTFGALRAVADDHEPHAAVDVAPSRATARSHALDRLDAADRQHVVAVRAAGAAGPASLRRMIQRLGAQAVELLEARRGVARVGEEPRGTRRASRCRAAISCSRSADVELRVGEVAVRGAAQLVRGAVLVDEPRDLVRVPDEVGRELRAR